MFRKAGRSRREQSCQHDQQRAESPALGRLICTLLTLALNHRQEQPTLFAYHPHDRMAEGDTSLRNTARTIWVLGYETFRLSNLYPFITGRSEQSAHHLPNNHNRIEGWEGSLRLIPINIPRLEPRASSPHDSNDGQYSSVVQDEAVVYPGVYRVCIYRVVYLPPGYTGIYTRVYLSYQGIRAYTPGYTSHTRLYTTLGIPLIPGYTPPWVYPRCNTCTTPWVYPRCNTCTTPWVYLRFKAGMMRRVLSSL